VEEFEKRDRLDASEIWGRRWTIGFFNNSIELIQEGGGLAA
jgi:hypothetical protein